MMPMIVKREELFFTCPLVSSKLYVAKGPSGWLESFKRAELDRELEAFTKPLIAEDLVFMFVESRALSQDREETNWHTLIGWIARTLGIEPKLVPPTVGIAFWGRVVIATTATQGTN